MTHKITVHDPKPPSKYATGNTLRVYVMPSGVSMTVELLEDNRTRVQFGHPTADPTYQYMSAAGMRAVAAALDEIADNLGR